MHLSPLFRGRLDEKEKSVRIVLSFDGSELGWRKIRNHLEMASSWVAACVDLVGRSAMKMEEENILMEVSMEV